MTRLIIVGAPSLLMLRATVEAFVSAAVADARIELIALVDGDKQAATFPRRVAGAFRHRARTFFNAGVADRGPSYVVLARTAERFGLPLLTPPGRNLNAPDFITELRDHWRPNALLSLGCLQIFRLNLLNTFQTAINFHNGLLPDYRGLNATGWSIYNGEARTGYSFHHITPGVDEGGIVLDNSRPLRPGETAEEADRWKCFTAANDAKAVLDAIATGEPGREQTAGSYYSAKDRRRIGRIANPETLTADEIELRLRAFGLLDIRIDGAWWQVTALADQGAPRIPTADRPLAVARAMFLPPTLYRLYRLAKRAT